METLAKFTKFTYKRKINLHDRYTIVQLYEAGYAISRIAPAFQIKTHSIRHHLQAMGVLEKERKVKRWGEPVTLQKDFDNHIDSHLPPKIKEVYRKMFEEDEEMRRRLPSKKSHKHIQHKGLLADVPREVPFKAVLSFTL